MGWSFVIDSGVVYIKLELIYQNQNRVCSYVTQRDFLWMPRKITVTKPPNETGTLASTDHDVSEILLTFYLPTTKIEIEFFDMEYHMRFYVLNFGYCLACFFRSKLIIWFLWALWYIYPNQSESKVDVCRSHLQEYQTNSTFAEYMIAILQWCYIIKQEVGLYMCRVENL